MDKVLIIGGGVIGLSIARELKKKGISEITILERGEIGMEASYAAGGMLAVHAETDNSGDFFNFCNDSLKLYSDFAASLFEETDVNIELDKAGTLYLAFTENDVKEIRERYNWQKKAGLDVQHLSANEINKLEPFVSPDVLEGLFFPNDWQVENRQLLFALTKFAGLNQVEIVENTEVVRILSEHGKVTGVETNSQKYFADLVILATGAWTSLIKTDGFSLPNIKPIRGQIISFQTAKRLFSKVIYSPRGYLIPRQDGRILVGSTSEEAGFDKSVTPIATDILFEKALEISPSLVSLEIKESWAGLRPFASDGLPILGEIEENLFVATGHYRNGILLAPITAKIIVEKIVNKVSSTYFETFKSERFAMANNR